MSLRATAMGNRKIYLVLGQSCLSFYVCLHLLGDFCTYLGHTTVRFDLTNFWTELPLYYWKVPGIHVMGNPQMYSYGD